METSTQTEHHENTKPEGTSMPREQAWLASQAATTAVLEHAASHGASSLSCVTEMILYGARALNCYMSHPGLQLQTRDFDFKVPATSFLRV